MRHFVQILSMPGCQARLEKTVACVRRLLTGWSTNVEIQALITGPPSHAQIFESQCDPTKLYNGVSAIGCRLSHLKALQNFLNSGADVGIIFEDDAEDYSFGKDAFQNAIQQLPADWDMLFLGIHPIQGGKPYVRVAPNVLRIRHGLAAHAYMVNRRSAKVLIDVCAFDKREIDVVYHDLMQREVLAAFTVAPFCVTQRAGKNAATHNMLFHVNVPHTVREPNHVMRYAVDVLACTNWGASAKRIGQLISWMLKSDYGLHLLSVRSAVSHPATFPFPILRESDTLENVTFPDLDGTAVDEDFVKSIQNTLFPEIRLEGYTSRT